MFGTAIVFKLVDVEVSMHTHVSPFMYTQCRAAPSCFLKKIMKLPSQPSWDVRKETNWKSISDSSSSS